MWQLSKMHPKLLKWTQQKKKEYIGTKSQCNQWETTSNLTNLTAGITASASNQMSAVPVADIYGSNHHLKKQSQWNQWKTTSTSKLQINLGIQRLIQDGCTGMDQLNLQQTWSPDLGLEETCRNWLKEVHFPLIQTKLHKGYLCYSSMLHQNSEKIESQNKTLCRRKSYILFGRIQHTSIRPNHHETPC